MLRVNKTIRRYNIFLFLIIFGIIAHNFFKGSSLISKVYKEKRTEQLLSVKTFGGIFFYDDGVQKYIGGGERNTAPTEIFIINCEKNQVEKIFELPDSATVIAFSEVNHEIYFGGIGKAVLYVYDKDKGTVSTAAHFEDFGIYALAADGENIYVGTKDGTAAVYKVDLKNKKIVESIKDFTAQNIVYSLLDLGDKILIGCGTNAELYSFDKKEHNVKKMALPCLEDEICVYDMSLNSEKKPLLMLSPSYSIVQLKDDLSVDKILCEDTRTLKLLSPDCQYRLYETKLWNARGEALVFYKGAVVGKLAAEDAYNFHLDDSFNYGITRNGEFYKKNILTEEKTILDLTEYMSTNAVTPLEVIIDDEDIYFPDRCFTIWKNGKYFKSNIKNEPQASLLLNNELWTANYTDASIWVYPTENIEEINLEEKAYCIGKIANQCRPYQMDSTKGGKYIALGTGPLYGEYGGALTIIDCIKEKIAYTEYDIVPNHTISSVICDNNKENFVYFGTKGSGETSTKIFDEQSHIVKWDIAERKAVWDISLGEINSRFDKMIILGEFLYVLDAHGYIYKCNTDTGEVIAENKSIRIVDFIEYRGKIYGVTNEKTLVQIDGKSLEEIVILTGFQNLKGIYSSQKKDSLYVLEEESLYEIHGL